MILDGLLRFDPPGTALTTTAVSTNVLDMAAERDMGVGDDPALKVAIFVDATFTGGTSLQVQLQGAPNSSGSPGTYVTLAESRAYLTAELVVGAKLLAIDLPAQAPESLHPPRFYRLNYVIVGTYTAGSLSAQLVLDRQDWRSYPAGINISN